LVFESVEQIQILKNFADQVHLQIQELIETALQFQLRLFLQVALYIGSHITCMAI
jgi:hypothetical protein